jgi:putative DNA primase/helicase
MVADFVKRECLARADGQIERVAQRLGLFAAAGELAIALDVVPWPAGEARNAAAWAFRAWLDNRGGAEPGEARQAISTVRLFLEQHGDSRFDPVDDTVAKPSPNRAGWRKGEGEAREWYVPPETWKAEICQGLDATFVARTLAERGFLQRIGDGFLAVRRIGGRNARVYVVNASILAGGEIDA